MGEYAIRNSDGERIKIGTCESLTDLRADQAHLVTAEHRNANPLRPDGFRFRFPFPNEDDRAPGDFTGGTNVGGLNVPGITVTTDHYSVQFLSNPLNGGPRGGYNVSLPCPASPEAKDQPYKMHRNGGRAGVNITEQRPKDGKLMLVAECAGCGAAFRMETIEDASDVLNALAQMADDQDDPNNRFGSEQRARYFREVARRIREGYENPPEWLAYQRPAAPEPEPEPEDNYASGDLLLFA